MIVNILQLLFITTFNPQSHRLTCVIHTFIEYFEQLIKSEITFKRIVILSNEEILFQSHKWNRLK